MQLYPYQAKYYDGETAYGYDATFTLSSAGLHVKLDGLEYPFDLPWEHLNREEVQQNALEIRLSFFEYPEKTLEITDEESIHAVSQALQSTGMQVNQWKKASRSQFVIWSLAAVGLLILGWISFNPLVGLVAEKVPMETERKLGQQMKQLLLSSQRVAQVDSSWVQAHEAYLQHFQLSYSGYEFILVKSNVVNAFALPGGTIVIFTGMLDKLNSPEQYFALLAHEVGHIERRHITRNLIRASFLAAVLSFSMGDLAGLSIVLSESAQNLSHLHFSRGLEQEADEFALEQFRRNGFNAEGAAKLFDVLATLDKGPSFEYLSSHPLSTNRAEKARAYQLAYPGNKPMTQDLQQAWVVIQSSGR